MARSKDTIAARAIISRVRDMILEIETGKVNTNWVIKITINGTIKPMNTRRCMKPGYRSCKILR
jgi:hypothetical protein